MICDKWPANQNEGKKPPIQLVKSAANANKVITIMKNYHNNSNKEQNNKFAAGKRCCDAI